MADQTHAATRFVAERVRRRRIELGLSQVELATMMTRRGVPWKRTTVVNLEANTEDSRSAGRPRESVTLHELLALAAVLRVPVTALIPGQTRDEEMEEQMTEDSDPFKGWAILELMGHRRLAGMLSEQQLAAAAFVRIDIPGDPPVTQLYSPAAVYAVTPCTEETARQVAGLGQPAPVQRWELPAAEEPY